MLCAPQQINSIGRITAALQAIDKHRRFTDMRRWDYDCI